MVALALPVMIGVTALGLDAGMLYLQRRQAQTAAEAAALAGAYAIKNGSSFSAAQTAAVAAGTQNGITVTTSQVTQPQTGYVAVSVTSTRSRLFSALWGSGNMSATASATARAFSSSSSSSGSSGSAYSPLAIILLDKTAASGLYITGSASLAVTGGGIQVNSNAAAVPYSSSAFYVGNMGSMSAPSIAVVGTTWLQPYGTGTVTPSTPTAGSVVADPLANGTPPISAPSLSAAQALGTYTNYSTGNGKTYTMSPGYYSGGVNIGASTVTMSAGTYYIAGGDFYVANNAVLTGTGVTIYLAPGATASHGTYPCSTTSVSIQSASQVNLSAPSSGTYAGLVIYVDPSNTGAVQFGNNQSVLNVTGTIYCPASMLDVTGYANQTLNVGTQIVADTMRVENNAKVKIAYTSTSAATPPSSGSSSSSFALVK
jgi:Flp pilus assembly protein TadG